MVGRVDRVNASQTTRFVTKATFSPFGIRSRMMLRLEGEHLVVRQFRDDELDGWIAGQNQLGREALPGGSPDPEQLRRRVHESGTLRNGAIDMAIEADGRLIGYIQTYRPRSRVLPPDVYEMGVALWYPGDRGKGYGMEAVQLFVAWLFEQGAQVVQGGTAAKNHAMRRVFEKLGFRPLKKLDVDGVEETLYGVTAAGWSEAFSTS
jgi:RimJ/RimL family protein N-acetyltransferase